MTNSLVAIRDDDNQFPTRVANAIDVLVQTGIATANLRDRATHTGTQAASTINDLAEFVEDTVGAMLVSGGSITIAYDDATGKVSVTSPVDPGTDTETVRDAIGAALVGIQGLTVGINDAADTITLGISGLTIGQISNLQITLDGKASQTDLLSEIAARQSADAQTLADAKADASAKANAARDEAKTASIAKTGGSMTGPLVLAADPTSSYGAVTKQYADALVAALTSAAPEELNTFLEAFQRFQTDESALNSLTQTVANRQPLDDDLTAIAGLATQTFGRSLLTYSSAADVLAALGAATAQSVTDERTRAVAVETTRIPFLRAKNVVTVPTALTLNQSQPYDATNGSIAAATLPALADTGYYQFYGWEKTDTTPNTVVVSTTGTDLTSSGKTSITMDMPGVVVAVVDITPTGNKVWRVVAHTRADSAIASRYVASEQIRRIMSLSKTAYDALASKNPNTLYITTA